MIYKSKAVPVACAGAVALLAIASCGERPGGIEAPPLAAVASSEPETVRELLYRCTSGREVAARYVDGGGKPSRAELLYDGVSYDLHAAPAASGALYVTAEGRSPGRGLHWHSQDAEAVLSETLSGDESAGGVPVETCHEQPENHAEAG